MPMIDTEEDHFSRAVNINYVLNMCMKACKMDDGSYVINPTFTKTNFPNQYNNCICGHYIENNHLATCIETGKSFIVGCVCIETVCNLKKWTLKTPCCYCSEDSMKTKKYCKSCSKMIKSTILNKDLIITFGSKHPGAKFIDIYNKDKSYINYVKLQDMPYRRNPFAIFKLWIIDYEKYYQIIEDLEKIEFTCLQTNDNTP